MRAECGPYTAARIAEACKGAVLSGSPEAVFHAICTDSRNVQDNDLFVPLKGANFDGHDFLLPALEAGARGSLVNRDTHRDIFQNLTKFVLIQVQDTLQALSDLASAHRIHFSCPLIAVTGSSGKTTVKEMIAAVLRRSHRPLVSEKNFNNTVGLPMTVLGIGAQHTSAVVEAGINMPDEMNLLGRAARPNVAVITTVGPVHLEGLGSVEGVAREKFKLVEALPADGTAVLPAKDPHIEPLLARCRAKVVTFGTDQGDFRAEAIVQAETTSFTMVFPGGRQAIRLSVPGRHNVANALAAAAACMAIGVAVQDVVAGLEAFVPPEWRMEIISTATGARLIRDCYNANPQSMSAALEVLAGASHGPKLALLGDMKELGERSAELHSLVGKQAAALGVDMLVHVGEFGSAMAKGFVEAGGDSGSVMVFPDREAAWQAIRPAVARYSAVLVKGSRAMRMELLAEKLLEEN